MAFVSDVPVIERACIAGDEPLELLFCHDTAREARVPLLFVHGGYVGAWCWEKNFMPWFAARGFPVYALSLRGHGASGDRANLHAYRVADYAEDVAAAIAHLPRASGIRWARSSRRNISNARTRVPPRSRFCAPCRRWDCCPLRGRWRFHVLRCSQR
jgi:hypothetical protein